MDSRSTPQISRDAFAFSASDAGKNPRIRARTPFLLRKRGQHSSRLNPQRVEQSMDDNQRLQRSTRAWAVADHVGHVKPNFSSRQRQGPRHRSDRSMTVATSKPLYYVPAEWSRKLPPPTRLRTAAASTDSRIRGVLLLKQLDAGDRDPPALSALGAQLLGAALTQEIPVSVERDQDQLRCAIPQVLRGRKPLWRTWVR